MTPVRPIFTAFACAGLLALGACAARKPSEAEVLTVACSAGIAEACGYLSRGRSVTGTPL